MFEQIARDSLKEFNVIASCLEIYNETVIDLLRDPANPVSLDLWDDADQGLLIPNLVKVNVGNLDTVGFKSPTVSDSAQVVQGKKENNENPSKREVFSFAHHLTAEHFVTSEEHRQ